jgi:hypothetical protein
MLAHVRAQKARVSICKPSYEDYTNIGLTSTLGKAPLYSDEILPAVCAGKGFLAWLYRPDCQD